MSGRGGEIPTNCKSQVIILAKLWHLHRFNKQHKPIGVSGGRLRTRDGRWKTFHKQDHHKVQTWESNLIKKYSRWRKVEVKK